MKLKVKILTLLQRIAAATQHSPKNIAVATDNSAIHQSEKESYFCDAKDWAYERFQMQEVMANRWQLAFWCMLICCLLLVVAIFVILPLKSWEPIVIRRNTITGEVRVDPARSHFLPESAAEIQSDLVRYVIARETFSMMDLNSRMLQVIFSSSPSVAHNYQHLLTATNPHNLIAQYGENGLRTVKVQDVIFIDAAVTIAKKQANQTAKLPTLAKVDFVSIETIGQQTQTKYWVATIRFRYLGTPNTPEAAWINWNGFTVINYRVDQRNL